MNASTLIHGAASLGKAALGIGRADDETLARRRAVCLSCPDVTTVVGGIIRKCGLCGCLLPAKILNQSEKCPAGKW